MAVVASATGAAVFGLSGVAAGLAGGALLGAGAGALYSGITGDGNILNSALTGGLLGATAGGIGAALAPAAATGGTGLTAGAGAAKGITAGATPAATAYGGASSLGSVMPAVSSPIGTSLAAPTLGTPLTSAYGALGGAGSPAGITATQAAAGLGPKAAGMTGGQKLAAGLAGTTALSLLGGRNQPTLKEQESNSYIRPYTYSQKRNPNYGQPGESYFIQSYEAGEPYKAASGGIMRMADGGAAQPIVPMQQLAAPSSQYAPAVGSPEAQVAGLYRNVLGRAPDAAGSKFWEDAINSGASQNQIRQGFTQSPENQAREAQRGQVAAYNQLLAERANNEYNVQPAPLSTLPGGGERAGLEDTKKIINQYYLSNLGRQGEQAGLDFWAKGKENTGMSLADVNKAIQGSNEGQVFSAYRDLLGRRPDEEGSRNWQQALASGMSNEDLRKSIMSSQEYLSRPAATKPAAKPDQTGYTYDPVTKRFIAPTPAAPAAEPSGGLTDITQDPGFRSYIENQYRNYQQSQSGGGAAGGLMPGSLKYAMGGDVQSYNLGGYSDGGRLLRGPGDGVSDDIPATIGNRQPARLADGEFVIPARIVSELGNGSTDAGAKRLYAMMDRIQAGRKKTVGKGNVAKDTKAKKHLLA